MCAATGPLSFGLFLATFGVLFVLYLNRAIAQARAGCVKDYDIFVFLDREQSRPVALADRRLAPDGIDERDIDVVLRCRRRIRRVGLGLFLLTGFGWLWAAEGLRNLCAGA